MTAPSSFPLRHVFRQLFSRRCSKPGTKVANVRAYRIEGLANLQRLRAAVLIDDSEPGVAILPPNALPRMTSCTRGKIIDASISAANGKICAFRAPTLAINPVHSSTPGSSWPQPRTLRHHEGIAFCSSVAQLPAPCNARTHRQRGCSAPGERLHRHARSHGHFTSSVVVREPLPVSTRYMPAPSCCTDRHFIERVQPLLPIFRRILELRFNYIRPGQRSALQGHRLCQSDQLPVIYDGDAVARAGSASSM